MIKASENSGKILQIGHCIRFWPGYDMIREIVTTMIYGKVKTATFQRLSLSPTWAWNNWILDGPNSGGASLDMHIHDSDFVQYIFGMPAAVRSFGVKGPSNDYDHIVTNYIYKDDIVVTAEGGWMMAPGFGFEMSFNIVLEKATIVFDSNKVPAFRICQENGGSVIPDLKEGDGYSLELEHFIKCVSGENVPQITTPSQSMDSVRLVLAEKESARKGREVRI
jgi:predicted dehydrogenase